MADMAQAVQTEGGLQVLRGRFIRKI
jgi:hypothetical protein